MGFDRGLMKDLVGRFGGEIWWGDLVGGFDEGFGGGFDEVFDKILIRDLIEV